MTVESSCDKGCLLSNLLRLLAGEKYILLVHLRYSVHVHLLQVLLTLDAIFMTQEAFLLIDKIIHFKKASFTVLIVGIKAFGKYLLII